MHCAMSDLPPLPRIVLGRYRHYTGGEYEVVGVVRHSETLEPLVLYRPLRDDVGLWVRPFDMFLETVEHAGTRQTRFSLIPSAAADTQEELAAGAMMQTQAADPPGSPETSESP
jgi:hypothetical protein